MAALVALGGGAVVINRFLVGVFYDDGLYAGLALALAHGLGYVHPHLPHTPAAVHYPPLWPLMLAPIFGLLPLGAAALAGKVLNLLLAAAAAGLVAWHAERVRLLGDDAPIWLVPAVVGGTAIAIPILATQAVLFSEPLFAVLLATTVILADRPPPAFSPRAAALLLGAVIALALLERSIAIAVAGGVTLWWLGARRARWRELPALLVLPAVGAALWEAWLLSHRHAIDPAMAINYGTYFETVKETGLAAFGRSAPDLARPIAALTLGYIPSLPLFLLFGACEIALGLYGLWLLRRRSSIAAILVLYLAILAIWPFPPDRFLWVVLPWLALAWAAGVNALWRHRHLRLPVLVVTILVTGGYASYEIRGFANRWWGSTAHAISLNWSQLLPWLGAELPKDAVLATDDEALVWLYTGRTTVPFYVYGYSGRETVEPTPADHLAYLRRMGVTHILLSGPAGESARELDALLGAYPGLLTIVHGWPGRRALFVLNRER
ncbi:MAG TPA: hypothetical protein VFK78_06650 [Gemmatimonadales bacterium]|nr:hypothetical protein [Gemmatimonadales bacterium]